MNASGMLRRVVAGLGANAVGMALTIGLQLASLPLFLLHWDTATYGVWLMLSALPGYLAMADVGMVTAAGNQMAMAVGAGNTAHANRVFHSAQLFMALVCGVVLLLATPTIAWLPWQGATADQRWALWALCAGVLLAFVGGLSEQVFKATQRYALGTMLGNTVRLVEWLGWMLGLWVWGGFAAVALCGLCARLLATMGSVYLARQHPQGLTWGWHAADRSTLRQMVKPAAAFMAFPLANALSFQGVTLLVGAFLGPVAVATFSTYRTLARSCVQLTGLFSHALWPEFSRLYGQAQHTALHKLAHRSTWLNGVQAVLASVVLYVLAPWVLAWWTHGQIAFEPQTFAVLMAYAAVGGLWHVPRVVLMATNQHGALAYWSLVAAAACVLAVAWGAHAQGLLGVGGGMLLGETLIAAVCMCLVWRRLSPVPSLQKVGT